MTPDMQKQQVEQAEYLICSTVHHPKTRAVRSAAPVHHRHKAYVLSSQRRLVPNKHLHVTKTELLQNLDELRDLESQGRLEVRLMSHELVDLSTLTALPLPVVKPYVKLLDSAANDLPFGKPTGLPINPEPAPSVDASGGGLTAEALEESKKEAAELSMMDDANLPIEDAPVPPDAMDDAQRAAAFGGSSPISSVGEEATGDEEDIEQEAVPVATTTKKKRK